MVLAIKKQIFFLDEKKRIVSFLFTLKKRMFYSIGGRMKKGFTLVEVMTVVVIIGILAVVAVPQLFGQIAKAKVSEVAVASSAYMKLQDAYLTEG